MNGITSRLYEGSINIGNETEGVFDVNSTGISGSTKTSGQFNIQYMDESSMACHNLITGLSIYPYNDLYSNYAVVTIGQNDFIISHQDPNNILISGPSSFNHQNGTALGSDYTVNWFIPYNDLLEYDQNTISLCKYNEISV